MATTTLDLIFPFINLVVGGMGGVIVVLIKMAKYQQKVDDLKEDMKEAIKKIDALRTDADTLKEFRSNAQKFIDKNLYESKSPLQLSEFGKKIVEESGFARIFSECKDDLVQKLKQKDPKNQYDVQEKARALMNELGEYIPFQQIKTYAFKNGLDFLQILRAGSILLRDYYFSLYPILDR
jgi:uncharacterized protein YihD (DUF1040 family)